MQANYLLLLTALIWGGGFVAQRLGMQYIGPFIFNGFRFLIGGLTLLPVIILRGKGDDETTASIKQTLVIGCAAGLLIFFGATFQQLGLVYTSAGKAGFITGLSTIIVPFLAWFVFKKPLSLRIWIAVILSVIGMAFLLLEGETTGGIIIGDILVLICAFFFAFYIVLNDKYVRLSDIYLYSMIQIFVISISSFIVSFFLRESYDIFSMPLTFWIIMIYMGIAVMSLTFLFQNWSQQYQDPTTVALIFTLEPVFAALFGFLIGNEILSILGWIGCGLIFAAILIIVLKNRRIKKKSCKIHPILI